LETDTPQKSVERQTARIASIKELTSGKYIRQEGWNPNYILTRKNEKISRANIVGVIVTIPDNSDSVYIDDGTDKIEARSFEDKTKFNDMTIGDIVLIIGRPREYNGKVYLNCEIIKKIVNKDWLEFRKKEILLKNIRMPDIPEQIIEESLETPNRREKEEPDKIDEILMIIKEKDKGAGCEIVEITGKYPKAEEIIEQLLLKGEIFEISPGKVKVLE
jgi:RPA family protein